MNNCNVVLVEDSVSDASLLKHFLELEGVSVNVEHFLDGEAAYGFFSTNQDLAKILLVLDLNLPGMKGVELLGKMKESGIGLPHTIVFSGSENPEDKDESIRAGARVFYRKPWIPSGYRDFINQVFVPELRQICPG